MVDVYSYYGMSSLREIVGQWAQLGLFDILLPFLLIFTLVFAILEKIDIFKNRGVNLVISIVLGFFAITNPYVSIFFLNLFSNMAIGISILLVMIILLGLTLKEKDEAFKWVFGVGGAILLLVVLTKAGLLTYIFGPNGMSWLRQNSAMILLLAIIALMMAAVYQAIGDEKNKHEFIKIKK